jgi:hypothetical protein
MGGLAHSHDILSTSVLLDDMDDSCVGSSVVECCICLERRPEVILPCAHSYCLPCIEQWYETCRVQNTTDVCNMIYFRNVNNKTCPICREKLESTDDSWVISEAPGSEEVNKELEKSLFNLSGGNNL